MHPEMASCSGGRGEITQQIHGEPRSNEASSPTEALLEIHQAGEASLAARRASFELGGRTPLMVRVKWN